jgi:hypothetical protein
MAQKELAHDFSQVVHHLASQHPFGLHQQSAAICGESTLDTV